MSNNNALKEYGKPPVVEMGLAVQFPRLHELNTVTMVHLLEHLSEPEQWNFLEQPYQPPRYETDQLGTASTQISFGAQSPDRSFSLLSPDRTQLITLQPDRFGIRWYLQTGQDYIRYSRIKQMFADRFSRMIEWLRNNNFGLPVVEQTEAQYVNLVDYGDDPTAYFNFMDLSGFREAEGIQFSTSQRISDTSEVGRLYLEAQTQQIMVMEIAKPPQQKKVLKIFLTFRGKPSETSEVGVLAHLDRANEAIVTTFTQSLSELGRKTWEEKDRTNE